MERTAASGDQAQEEGLQLPAAHRRHPALGVEGEVSARDRPHARTEADHPRALGLDSQVLAQYCLSLWEWIKPRVARVRGAYEPKRSCSLAPLTPTLSQRERGFSATGR